MYTNNTRLIESLVASNNEILSLIQTYLNFNTQHNIRNNNRRANNISVANQRNSNTIPTATTNTILLEAVTDNGSYIIDYVQPDQITQLLQNFMDPIPISPSQAQIENATSMIRYGEIESPLNNSCPISLEPFHENDTVVMINYCSHLFKPTEIQHWFQTNVRCPVCRYDIRTRASSRVSTRREIPLNNNNQPDRDPLLQQQPTTVENNLPRTSQERNSRRTNQPTRILQRGETLLNRNSLLDSFFNTIITDLSNNSI
jgi:hypothetical protein